MVVQAIIETLHEEEKPVQKIVVGFDTRMLSEKFARAAAELMASEGVPVMLAGRDVPSPVLAASVIEHGEWRDDIRALAKPSLRHRIAGNYAAQANNLGSEQLIEMLMDAIPPDKQYEKPAA